MSTEEIMKIRTLQSQLPQDDVDYMAERCRYNIVDGFYQGDMAHHSQTVICSRAVGDYQVFRLIDIEVEPVDIWSMAVDEWYAEHEHDNCPPDDDEKEAWIEEREVQLIDEGYEDEFEWGEFAQVWLNVNTKERLSFGKINRDDAFYCTLDKDVEWTMLNPCQHDNAAVCKFIKHFGINDSMIQNEGFYVDLSVHPKFLQWGYTGIDATDWYWGCGEDDNKSEEAKFFLKNSKESWIDFLYSFEHGNEYDTIFKAFGSYAYFASVNLPEKDRLQYLAATKIARRNRYQITDQGLWDDMVQALVKLGKDVHNAHYVCPADLKEAHDRWTKLYQKKKDAIKAAECRKQALMHEADYAERMQNFIGIGISTERFDVFVCPSVAAMADEGNAMHHCVYQMGYYKADKNCIILLTRLKDGSRLATSRVQLDKWNIAETRGVCNSVPKIDGEPVADEINAAISKLIPRLVKASKKENETIIVNMNTAAQPVAVAA